MKAWRRPTFVYMCTICNKVRAFTYAERPCTWALCNMHGRSEFCPLRRYNPKKHKLQVKQIRKENERYLSR